MKKQMVALLAGALLMMATSAMATPISGSINFIGAVSFTGTDINNNGIISAAEATGVKFLKAPGAPSSLLSTGANEWVNSVTGDYAALPDPASNDVFAFFNNFTFAPFLIPSPVTVWSVLGSGTTYDFKMTSVSYTVTPDEHLLLSGLGKLGITGYEDTLANWTFSSDGYGSKLAFSAASTVPEPGTMMLLGMGMLGLAIFGKRRMNKNA